MEVPLEGERTPAQSVALLEEMQRRLAALPGVTEVGIGWNVPLRASNVQLELTAEGRAEEPGVPRPTAPMPRAWSSSTGPWRSVSFPRPGSDRPAHRVDRRRLRFIPLSGDWRTVIGVVGDTQDAGPDAPPLPAVYQPLAQNDMAFFPGAVVIRARGAEDWLPATANQLRRGRAAHRAGSGGRVCPGGRPAGRVRPVTAPPHVAMPLSQRQLRQIYPC